jgi:hypothetical protein
MSSSFLIEMEELNKELNIKIAPPTEPTEPTVKAPWIIYLLVLRLGRWRQLLTIFLHMDGPNKSSVYLVVSGYLLLHVWYLRTFALKL